MMLGHRSPLIAAMRCVSWVMGQKQTEDQITEGRGGQRTAGGRGVAGLFALPASRQTSRVRAGRGSIQT